MDLLQGKQIFLSFLFDFFSRSIYHFSFSSLGEINEVGSWGYLR
jgi:hypothetical protein